jgi:hypothetical protein
LSRSTKLGESPRWQLAIAHNDFTRAHQQIAERVKSALEYTREERAAFPDKACEGEAELRAEVDSFLQFQDEASQFIAPSKYDRKSLEELQLALQKVCERSIILKREDVVVLDVSKL